MFDKDMFVQALMLGNRFKVDHVRNGLVIAKFDIHNDITTEGKNKLLDCMFHNDTQANTWYLGLVDVTNFVAVAVGDEYVNIDQAGNQWDEFTDYEYAANATARAEWQEDAASGGSISNTTVATFDIDGAGSVWGIFLGGGVAGANTQGDNSVGGTLWATANFTANVVVANTDQLKVTYTVTA